MHATHYASSSVLLNLLWLLLHNMSPASGDRSAHIWRYMVQLPAPQPPPDVSVSASQWALSKTVHVMWVFILGVVPHL